MSGKKARHCYLVPVRPCLHRRHRLHRRRCSRRRCFVGAVDSPHFARSLSNHLCHQLVGEEQRIMKQVAVVTAIFAQIDDRERGRGRKGGVHAY